MKLTGFVVLSLVASANGFISNFPKPNKSLGTRAIAPKKKPAKPVEAKKGAKPKLALKKSAKPKIALKTSAKPKVSAKKVVKPKVIAKKVVKPKVTAKKVVKPKVTVQKSQALPKTIDVLELPGVLPPVGFFDPLGLAAKANDNLILKYREAELTHGRVAMVAFLGFLFGELASGYNGILNLEVTGYAIGQIDQVPGSFWALFWAAAFGVETSRNQNAVVDPTKVDRNSLAFGSYNPDTLPGDIGFDPLGLRPSDPEELKTMQTKELQHGRVAMIASSGFLAQELADNKGIVEHGVDFFTPFFS